jgi:hypothetical protein
VKADEVQVPPSGHVRQTLWPAAGWYSEPPEQMVGTAVPGVGHILPMGHAKHSVRLVRP